MKIKLSEKNKKKKLIEKKNLNGFESKKKFYHASNLEIFKKLEDL